MVLCFCPDSFSLFAEARPVPGTAAPAQQGKRQKEKGKSKKNACKRPSLPIQLRKEKGKRKKEKVKKKAQQAPATAAPAQKGKRQKEKVKEKAQQAPATAAPAQKGKRKK